MDNELIMAISNLEGATAVVKGGSPARSVHDGRANEMLREIRHELVRMNLLMSHAFGIEIDPADVDGHDER